MSRLFGTNGVRGVTNDDMNVELALNLGRAIGTFFAGDIAIGTDTRTSNEMLKQAVVAGITSTGCDVFDAGLVPSPVLQYYVRQHDLAAGVIITASHNPPQFNGIKVVAGDGTELGAETEEQIEGIYFSQTWTTSAWHDVGMVQSVAAIGGYLDGVTASVDVAAIAEKQFTVVADCGNGAGCVVYPYLLRQLGCRVITLNAQPDGTFPGRNAEPVEENVGELVSLMQSSDADLGVAYDGDADRAIFVDENGGYVSGDKTLAITAAHAVAEHGGIVVTPVSTSSCVEEMVKQKGGTVHYTQVGSPIVARKMIEVDATFGGEENGGLIFPGHQYCRDGGMATAALLEIMALRDMPLSALAAEVPSYALVKTKVSCPHERKQEIMQAFIDAEEGEVDTTDGAKVMFDDAWVLVRPSGTEPIIRVYVEATEPSRAEELAERYRNRIAELVG
ncbi:MAG: phosphoglucosamine mutase [Thermoplasmatota archaeon]